MTSSANPNAGLSSTILGNTSAGLSGTNSAGATGSSTSDGSSLLSDLGSGISSFLNSPIGSLTEFGALAGLGLSQASSAESQAANAAGQLTATGAPYTAAGQNVLGQFTGSEPASAAQQTQAATTLGNIANTAFSNYQSGTLSPADQASLDATVAQQKQQVAQQLASSGISDSSALDTADQQIDSNALINKQNLLNSQFQTGQAALTQVQSTYTGLLNNALSASEFGLGALSEGLNLQITQDAQITQSLNNLFGQIARGVGSAFGGSGSSGGTSGSSAGGLAGAAGKAASSLLGNAASGAITSGSVGAISNAGTNAIGSTVAGTEASDLAGISADTQASLDSSLGLTGAGGAAAAGGDAALASVGTDAIGAEADAAAAADYGLTDAGAEAGADAAGSSAGLIGALPFAAAALPVAATLYGASQPAVALSQTYWDNAASSLQQTINSGDRGEIAAAVQGYLSMPQNQVPANVQQLIYSTGFVPSTGWGLPTMTAAQQQALQQQGVTFSDPTTRQANRD